MAFFTLRHGPAIAGLTRHSTATGVLARHAAATALLATAALAAGCGHTASPSASSNGTKAPRRTAPAASPATSSATASPACASSALTAKIASSQGGAAAGSVYLPLDFTNTSSAACTLYGYPGVSFVTASGHQLGRAAARSPSVPVATITLVPGATAHATLQVAAAGNFPPAACHLVTAHWLKVYPPNQKAALRVAFSSQTCSALVPRRDGNVIAVSAVVAGAGHRQQGG